MQVKEKKIQVKEKKYYINKKSYSKRKILVL